MRAGQLRAGAAFYAEAHRGWPNELAATRGVCEVGLSLAGEAPVSADTIHACHQALLATQGPRDLRNKVAALLAEKQRPDLDTIALAALMTESAIKQAPDEPWGTLARLDVARYLRRADLVTAARSDLQRFAETFPVVRAALTKDPIGRPAALVWIVRILALLGLIGTGVHAFSQRRKGSAANKASTTSPAAIASVVALLSLLVPASSAAAQPSAAADPTAMPDMKDGQLSRFKINDAHPAEAVLKLLKANQNPLELGYLLQDLAARVNAADAKHDNAALARYYHAMGLAAQTAFGPRKECEALEAVGDIPGAIVACRELLTRPGVIAEDYVHFVDLVLRNPKPLPNLEPKELENVIAHLEKGAKAGQLPTILRCKAAMRFEDRGALDKCRASLASLSSDDPGVLAIKWGLAVREHDRPTALVLVEKARRAGLDEQTVRQMLTTTDAMTTGRLKRNVIVAGGWILGIGCALFAAWLLNSSRQRGVTRSPA